MTALAQFAYAALPKGLRIRFLLLLLQLGQSQTIVPLLSADPLRVEIRPRLVERIKSRYGDDFDLTPHGVERPLARRYTADEQSRVLAAITAVMDEACRAGGITDWWFTYGTLLGLIREGALLPTDDDFDVAYLSRASTPEEVVAERRMIQENLRLLPGVSVVDENGGMFKVSVLSDKVLHFEFDLFTTYQTHRGAEMFMAPPGIAKTEWFLPTERREFLRATVVIPRNPEEVLAWLYGDGWKVPDPSYRARWYWPEHDFLRQGKIS